MLHLHWDYFGVKLIVALESGNKHKDGHEFAAKVDLQLTPLKACEFIACEADFKTLSHIT